MHIRLILSVIATEIEYVPISQKFTGFMKIWSSKVNLVTKSEVIYYLIKKQVTFIAKRIKRFLSAELKLEATQFVID